MIFKNNKSPKPALLRLVCCALTILLMSLPHPASAAGEAAKEAAGLHPAIQATPVNSSQRRDLWMARHEAFKARAADGGIDLLFLGDSITAGWETAGKPVWEARYSKRNAANFGINGDATQHLLWRIRNGELEGLSPKLIVLLIGSNNNWASGKPNSPQEILEGVQAVVDEIHGRLPRTKILLMAIFPRDAPDSPACLNNMAANRLLASLDGEHITFRDINSLLIKEDGALSADLFPDLLHPNAAGYERWAAAIEPDIAQALGEQSGAAPLEKQAISRKESK